jgi:DNA-binding LytR/AlgR family response regulator
MIIDDEPLAHDIVINYLAGFPELELKARFFNTHDAKLFLEHTKIDILFLDIKMPGEDGLEFLSQLVERPVTLMTTAFRDYALEGFDLGVMDYLVKPIKRVRFEQGIRRAIEFLELAHKNSIILDEPSSIQTNFTIKSGTRQISLEIDTITHIQGLKDYSILFTKVSKYVIKGYIKNVEKILPPGQFMRVHKSFIVAKHLIKVIDKNKIELDNHQIPIGRLYKSAVQDYLDRKE